MPKTKLPADMPCEVGTQWVNVQAVFVPGVTPMYAAKQRGVKIMEDAIGAKGDGYGWVVWNTDFLLEVE